MEKINMTLQPEIAQQIISNLKRDNSDAVEKGNHLRGLTCPECGQPEAYTRINDPRFLKCPRDNNCGKSTPTSTLYPELTTNYGERYGLKGEKASIAYLHSRGLDPTLIDFKQTTMTVDGKKYPMITFPTKKGDYIISRFIDKPPKTGKKVGKVLFAKGSKASKNIYQSGNLKKSKPVYVVEGAIDALSLWQQGYQAIALLSSSYNFSKNPQLRKLIRKGYKFVIAMDNDTAGKKAIKKLIDLFEMKKALYTIALPPRGKDWNDLLVLNKLNEEEMDKCFWRGEMFQAELQGDVKAFYQLLEQQYPSIKLFEFNGCYWYKSQENNFSKLSDFTCKILYSVVYRSSEFEPKIKNILEVCSKQEDKIRMMITGTNIVRNDTFKGDIANGSMRLWTGKPFQLDLLNTRLQKQNPKMIRGLDAHGYDKKSKCFVFPNVIYDRDGNKYEVGKEGYFTKQQLMPLQGDDIVFGSVSPSRFIKQLFDSFGPKSLIILGFYVSTLFSHLIQKKFKAFPFLMMTGAPHTGKTTLSNLLSRCFFSDDDSDIPAAKVNTKKGFLRELSQRKSLVSTIAESEAGREPIDDYGLLNFYHWGNMQVRAKFSNDNQTIHMPFEGALSFVQNSPIYKLGAVKTRFISVEFNLEDLTDKTRTALDKLKKFSDPSIGDQILKYRKKFEAQIVEAINRTQERILKEEDTILERIAFNHAVAFAGLEVFCEIFGIVFNARREKAYQYLVEIAHKKMENITTESDIAEDFFQTFADLVDNDDGLKYGEQYIFYKGEIFIRLPQTLKAMTKNGYHFRNTDLHDALKSHEASFRKSNYTKKSKDWIGNKKTHRCWVFSHKETGMGLDPKDYGPIVLKNKSGSKRLKQKSKRNGSIDWDDEAINAKH